MNTKNQLVKNLFKNPLIILSAKIALCLFFPQALKAATGTIDINTRYQMIEGFGASGAWYENWLTSNSQKDAMYDLFFNDLAIDIYRIRNTYDYDSAYMNNTAEIVSQGLARNPNLKILVSSWSPPTYLKSTGRLDEGTLIGGPSNYDYQGFAQWWYESVVAWTSIEVNPYYISIQNEPDWNGNDRCLFQPTQTTDRAGYDQAFETVWQQLYAQLGSTMPKMIAPETTGFQGASGYTPDQYLNALPNLSHLYGYAHHLYNCNNGGAAGCGDDPDLYIDMMTTFYSNWHDKPLMQTEYESSTGAWPDAFNMALLLHNSLTVENVSVYLYWDLFWNTGGLVSIPSYGGDTYIINSDYYGFKHFSHFVRSGWQRVSATDNSSDLRISAYVSPDYNQLSVVIINTNPTTGSTLDLSFNGFTVSAGSIYRTTSDQNCQYIGDYNSSASLNIPAKSVTTLSLSSNPPQFQTLNVSSTTGGSVTTPGQGIFNFPANCTVTLIATADIYYHFDYWSGSAVSAGKVADPCSANTTVLMDANYTLVANFAANPPDVNAPSPNPPVWESEPNAISSSAITMTVAAETDDSPPIQYYFECVNDVNRSSSWQTDRTYVASGLADNTTYSFRVKAQDSYLVPNETNFSEVRSATTWSTGTDFDPPSPNPPIWYIVPTATDSNTIVMVASSTTDASGVEYYFNCLTAGGHDSGWQDSNAFEDTNLSPNTQYTYRLKARDKSVNHNETGWSSEVSALTNFKILHRFTGLNTDGSIPFGNLLLYNDKFYGLTVLGGSNGNGTLFRMNMDGSGFQVLYSFTGASNSGWRPYGSLLVVGSKFYGLAMGGGTSGNGVVFRVNPDGSNFQVLHSFASGSSDGHYPQGSLSASGSTLFGLTSQGGSSDSGVLFKINTDGTGYQVLHHFTNGSDGGYPCGTPLAVGSVVYGATLQGGTAGYGVLFKINADGSGFQVLRSFNFSDGGYPYLDGPILYNSMIYGMTYFGGSNYAGVIYKMNLDGTGYQLVYNFSDGSLSGYPYSQTLARSGTVFYGTTAYAGANFNGTVFMVNTNGTGYQLLHSFAFPSESPYGSVYVSGSKIYGMTPQGGSGYGTIYRIDIPPDFNSCPGVQAAGFCLESDLNGDCYVDYIDLKIIADNWLLNGCTPPDYCHGADLEKGGSVDFIDLSEFAPQWMQYNDPAVPGFTQNWP
jgi:glucuronoarabinoxylan endo-1,4-beta-xylanase